MERTKHHLVMVGVTTHTTTDPKSSPSSHPAPRHTNTSNHGNSNSGPAEPSYSIFTPRQKIAITLSVSFLSIISPLSGHIAPPSPVLHLLGFAHVTIVDNFHNYNLHPRLRPLSLPRYPRG
ncbi:hypothetical protein B0T21DRAFT_371421 [Apiosordaria backusii]|uniref:Uncharacterized protein n=1 Tax=Apiosordaria backusii TaxID=314023 RepID=A0AA40E618_9PEZI|nr:hypothetical protein B0T21DRAFT_371421 [Apiosordaria backusii]